MKNKWIVLIAIFVLVGVFFVGCSSQQTSNVEKALTNDAKGTEIAASTTTTTTTDEAKKEEENTDQANTGEEEPDSEASADIKAQMMIANYIIAEQGVHLMAEELEKGNLDPGFLRKVQKAKTTAESIAWAPEVEEVKTTFYNDVLTLEKALIANDLEAAKEPAKAAHESQHDLDKQVGKVVKEITGSDIKAQMMIANYIIAEQGVHLMAEELEKGNLDPGFLRKVQKAKATVESIAWAPEVEEVKTTFYNDVVALEKALIANDVEAAKEPAKAAHESQHDLDKQVGKVVKEINGPDVKAQMMIANYIIAEQGVHLMAEELEKGNLAPGFLRKVQKAKATVESITWAPEVEEVKTTFYNDVIALEKALIANDVEAAKEPAKAAHESQHDLDKQVGKVAKENIQIVTALSSLNKKGNEQKADVEGPKVTIIDWGFENKLEIQKGKNVITLENTGKMPHGVVIPELGIISEDVAAGETIIWEIEVDKTGEFKFYCSVPECGSANQHGGMIGDVIVK